MKHGYGVYVKAGVEKYEGEFKEGRRHGKGKITLENGDVITGVWNMGTIEE